MFEKGIFILILLTTTHNAASAMGCKDLNGNDVDWFYVYKLPELRNSKSELVNNGEGHLYLDAQNTQYHFINSNVSMNDSKQAVGYTLNQLYNNTKHGNKVDTTYFLYNDEYPNGKKVFNHGHMKGVLLFNKDVGFWLVHSAPKFPAFANGSYVWPSNARKYGQSFLCMTLPTKALDNIANLLLYSHPNIYDYRVPKTFQVNEDLIELAEHSRKKISKYPWYGIESLSTIGGKKFTGFHKGWEFNDDLYESLVSPNLKTNLMVETWQVGEKTNRLPSNCSESYNVKNIEDIYMTSDLNFGQFNDHSKWCVSSKDDEKKFVCIGDINRQFSQYHRGGGTVCTDDSKIWLSYFKFISKYEECKKPDDTTLRFSHGL